MEGTIFVLFKTKFYFADDSTAERLMSARMKDICSVTFVTDNDDNYRSRYSLIEQEIV
jgi:hypothetical protein